MGNENGDPKTTLSAMEFALSLGLTEDVVRDKRWQERMGISAIYISRRPVRFRLKDLKSLLARPEEERKELLQRAVDCLEAEDPEEKAKDYIKRGFIPKSLLAD